MTTPKMVAHLATRAAAEKRANVVTVHATATSPNVPEPVAGFVLDARHDFLPRQHFVVYRVASAQPALRPAMAR